MLPIYELKINQSLTDDSQVSAIAFVDEPAILLDFLAFRNEFIEPSKGEHETDFIPRCIEYVVSEGKDQEQAAAICYSIWENHFAGEKVSIDYDDTLSTERGKELAKRLISEGKIVYIISARGDISGMETTAAELRIPKDRIFATGSNEAKVQKIKDLGIVKHYDNNSDVVKELGDKGQQFKQKFQIVNEEQRIVSGPLMVADQLIYRNNDKMGEHYVKFSAETIKTIAIKFSKKKYQMNVNLMHDPNKQVEGVTMFESFIVDKTRGIKPMEAFSDVPDGSWFGSFYVENPDVWNAVKKGELKGFSVEGLFQYDEPISKEEQALKEISKLLSELID